MSGDPFTPTVSLLVKLGSIAVHVEEMMSAQYRGDDAALERAALLLNDPEVREWLKTMAKMAMLPVKR